MEELWRWKDKIDMKLSNILLLSTSVTVNLIEPKLLSSGPVVQAHLVVEIQPRASCGPHPSTGGLCTNQLSHQSRFRPWCAKATVAESCAVDLRFVHRSFRFCSATERKPRTELAAGKTTVEKCLQHKRSAAATRKHLSVGILGLSPALYFERL